ncbi:hypothetical protein B0H19DRAFT_1275777 [Mycena capillaripes]|nr:hypothetical protein B0H19DRAFT_1275777 [Mycena capillaripes]
MATREISTFLWHGAPINLGDYREIRPFHAKLDLNRLAARSRGLVTGLHFALNFTIPAANTSPNAPHLPVLPHIRVDLPSQVWTAVAEFPRADGMLQTTTFVRKISEAWVYDHITDKQGLSIPYFFGLHEITTPSNESAWALVLEHIPGETLLTYLKLCSPGVILIDTSTSSIDTLTDFMSDGWIHPDLRPNSTIVAGSLGTRAVVLIDLFAAEWEAPGDWMDVIRRRKRRRLYNEIYDSLEDDAGQIQR